MLRSDWLVDIYRGARGRVLLAVTLAISVLGLSATVAQASVGGFSASDGTETGPGVNCTTLTDWSCLAASPVTAPEIATTLDPSGSGDQAFISGDESSP
jgi:hypothetical protein